MGRFQRAASTKATPDIRGPVTQAPDEINLSGGSWRGKDEFEQGFGSTMVVSADDATATVELENCQR